MTLLYCQHSDVKMGSIGKNNSQLQENSKLKTGAISNNNEFECTFEFNKTMWFICFLSIGSISLLNHLYSLCYNQAMHTSDKACMDNEFPDQSIPCPAKTLHTDNLGTSPNIWYFLKDSNKISCLTKMLLVIVCSRYNVFCFLDHYNGFLVFFRKPVMCCVTFPYKCRHRHLCLNTSWMRTCHNRT